MTNHAAPPPPADLPHKPPFWRDPTARAWIIQAVLLLLLALFFGQLFTNTLHNLEQRGIQSGFDFLNHEAGFRIIQTLVDYTESSSYARALLVGLLNTLMVSGWGIAIATLLGFVIGVARLSNNWLLARLATVYIETLRNIPLLLQLSFWYFAILRTLPSPRQSYQPVDGVFLNIRGLYLPNPLPQPHFWWTPALFGIGILGVILLARWARRRRDATGQPFPFFRTAALLLIGLPALTFLLTGAPLAWETPHLRGFNFVGGLTLIPEFVALLVALATYTAAFIAEIVRAGIQSVHRDQHEAASALGLKPRHTLWHVVLPQAVRVIIPPLTNQYLNLIKNSSLAAAIAYPDLVSIFAGTVLNQTGQAIEVIAITMTIYLIISLLTAAIMNRYNKRSAMVER